MTITIREETPHPADIIQDVLTDQWQSSAEICQKLIAIHGPIVHLGIVRNHLSSMRRWRFVEFRRGIGCQYLYRRKG